MSVLLDADTLTGWSCPTSRTVGVFSNAVESSTAPRPTSSRDAPSSPGNTEPRPLWRPGLVLSVLGGNGGVASEVRDLDLIYLSVDLRAAAVRRRPTV